RIPPPQTPPRLGRRSAAHPGLDLPFGDSRQGRERRSRGWPADSTGPRSFPEPPFYALGPFGPRLAGGSAFFTTAIKVSAYRGHARNKRNSNRLASAFRPDEKISTEVNHLSARRPCRSSNVCSSEKLKPRL